MRNEMHCPSCRYKLKQGDNLRIETTLEHVSNPNDTPSLKPIYFCSNSSCKAYHPFFSKRLLIEKPGYDDKKDLHEDSNIFWSEDGEIYSCLETIQNIKFIDNNSAPFGSLERRLQIEIYKKDENFTLLNLHYIIFKVIFRYKADEDGNILKRRFKIETWIKNDYSYTVYVGPIRMFLFCLKNFINKYRYYKKHNNEFSIREMREEFEKRKRWDKRLYVILFKFFINTFFFRTKIKLTNQKFKEHGIFN